MENSSYYILGSLLGAFFVAFFTFPSFIKLLEKKEVLDIPDHRKIHKRSIPGLGGVVVFASTMIALIFVVSITRLDDHRLFLGALVLVFIVGLRDDITPLRPSLKLLSQLVPTVLVFWLDEIRLTSLYSIWDVEFPLILSAFITCFTIIIIMNSFNLIDGIDGLAGSTSIASLSAFAVYFYLTDQVLVTMILTALIGGLFALLFYNWSPAKVFMGDNGALFLGFSLACASVMFINSNFQSQTPYFRASVGTAMCFIAVPLYDMFRIILLRIFKGRGLLTADKSHLHHLLLDLGLSHQAVTLLLLLVQVALITFAFIGSDFSEPVLFLVMAVVMFSLNGIVLILVRRKSQAQKAGV